MKPRPEVAVGVGIGYLLGRTKKMRLAFMVAGAAATGAMGNKPRHLLQQGAERLTSSPEFARLTEDIRGELFEAAKGAAITAVTHRLEGVTERLQEQVSEAEPDLEAGEEEPSGEEEEEPSAEEEEPSAEEEEPSAEEEEP
jgi:hypothetical protein